jgi:hypothetical protein
MSIKNALGVPLRPAFAHPVPDFSFHVGQSSRWRALIELFLVFDPSG